MQTAFAVVLLLAFIYILVALAYSQSVHKEKAARWPEDPPSTCKRR